MINASFDEARAARHVWVTERPKPEGWSERSYEEHAKIAEGLVWASRIFVRRSDGMLALLTVDEIDGKPWVHLSVSHKGRCPTYGDLAAARDAFLEPSLSAYQVFPAKAEHRNHMPFCLHLWQPLGRDPFPDPFLERANTVAA